METPSCERFCHGCGSEFPAQFQPGFRETCPKCQAYLHCCLNCRLYDPAAYHQCRSSTTEFVQDKAKANFCEEFDWKCGRPDTGKADRKPWDDLFK